MNIKKSTFFFLIIFCSFIVNLSIGFAHGKKPYAMVIECNDIARKLLEGKLAGGEISQHKNRYNGMTYSNNGETYVGCENTNQGELKAGLGHYRAEIEKEIPTFVSQRFNEVSNSLAVTEGEKGNKEYINAVCSAFLLEDEKERKGNGKFTWDDSEVNDSGNTEKDAFTSLVTECRVKFYSATK